jgi:hypothetical protein
MTVILRELGRFFLAALCIGCFWLLAAMLASDLVIAGVAP